VGVNVTTRAAGVHRPNPGPPAAARGSEGQGGRPFPPVEPACAHSPPRLPTQDEARDSACPTLVAVHNPDYRAAWVPDTLDLSWDDAADLAVAWVRNECAEQGSPGLVLYQTLHDLDSCPSSLVRFTQQNRRATLRSRVRGFHSGPVLAYLPSYRGVEIAANYARGSSLCVIEGSLDPLLGWAMEVQALDLTTGETTPDTRSAEMRESLAHLVVSGNNAWADSYGKRMAQHILRDLRDRGELDRDLLVGHVVAHHASDRAMKILDRLIQRT
jgi:hypothetical protein